MAYNIAYVGKDLSKDVPGKFVEFSEIYSVIDDVDALVINTDNKIEVSDAIVACNVVGKTLIYVGNNEYIKGRIRRGITRVVFATNMTQDVVKAAEKAEFGEVIVKPSFGSSKKNVEPVVVEPSIVSE